MFNQSEAVKVDLSEWEFHPQSSIDSITQKVAAYGAEVMFNEIMHNNRLLSIVEDGSIYIYAMCSVEYQREDGITDSTLTGAKITDLVSELIADYNHPDEEDIIRAALSDLERAIDLCKGHLNRRLEKDAKENNSLHSDGAIPNAAAG